MNNSKQVIIIIAGLLISLLAGNNLSLAQAKIAPVSNSSAIFPKAIVRHKTFNFLDVINKTKELKRNVKQNAMLTKVASQYQVRVEKALDNCQDARCYANNLQWTSQEIRIINQEFNTLFLKNKTFNKELTQALRQENYHLKYQGEVDTTLIRKAWMDTALGLNHILSVYLGGAKSRYPAIDSISYKATDQQFLQRIKQRLEPELKDQDNKGLFYALPMQAALNALEINGRDEAGRYEPLQDGYNKKPFQNIKKTDWGKYPYSMILVLGHGPEDPAIALDAGGAHYCEIAAQMYKEEVAPFIVVSGGNVHPYKTPYNEAEEMKKYLINKLGIPDEAVFIEPHARHTTTNLRNVSRLIYRFNIPDQKPVLTLTNPSHSKYTLNIHNRCMKELNYLPFRDMTKISDETNAFFPVKESLRVNPFEPLDP